MTTDEVTLDEAWETETGLLDDYDGVVVKSWFATDARYNNGETIMLHWEIETTDPETPSVTEKFPVGSGWDSRDGGATVVHERGKGKFNNQSIYGKIIDSVMKGDLKDVAATIRGRGRPTQANIWEGLSFHFKRVEFNYGGEIGAKSRVMPVKFLPEGAQPSIPGTTGAPAAAAPAAAPAAAEAPAAALADDVTLAKVRGAAQAAASHQAFLDAAMEIDGVVANDALMASIVDDSPTGFFATARA